MNILQDIYDHPEYRHKNASLFEMRARVVRLVSNIEQLIKRHRLTEQLPRYDGRHHYKECYLYFESKPTYALDVGDGPCVCATVHQMKVECLEKLNEIQSFKLNKLKKQLRLCTPSAGVDGDSAAFAK